MAVFANKEGFARTGALTRSQATAIVATEDRPTGATAVGIPVVAGGNLPEPLAWDLLGGVGFTGAVGQTHRVLHEGRPVQVLIGVGDRDTIDVAALRDAAAAFSNATDTHAHITVRLSPVPNVAAADAAQAIVEGVLLARYRYDALKSSPSVTALTDFSIVVDADAKEAVAAGVERGRITAGPPSSPETSPTPRPPCSPPRTWPMWRWRWATSAASGWKCSTGRPSPRWDAAGSSV